MNPSIMRASVESGSVINADGDSFKQIISSSKVPVLVDFWAPWCGPCRRQGPIIEELASEFKNQVIFLKVNVDSNPDLSQQYKIQSIPTMIVLKNGQTMETLVGLKTKNDLIGILRKHIPDPSI